MKNIYLTLALLSIFLASCNRDYYEDNYDIPTESIRFKELSVSKDTALMYDTIVLKAIAEGEDLQYKWQKNGGTLVPKKDDPSTAYFWGCPTCTGWLTVGCTVSNSFGAYTKDTNVYILKQWIK